MTLRYFAYGSNMLVERLTASSRVPSATNPTVATLAGYRLRFNKEGNDGSAKCNIVETGAGGDVVYGVVFEVIEAELFILDRVEGSVYARNEIALDDGSLALVYVAKETRENLVPWHWYRDLVLAGARQHDLPDAYIEQIHSTPAIADPQPDRLARQRALAALAKHRQAADARAPHR